MIAQVGLMQVVPGTGFSYGGPTGCAAIRFQQQEFFTGRLNSQVANVTAGKAATSNHTVARRSRPSGLYEQSTHAVGKRQEYAHHRRGSDAKPMRVETGHLNDSASPVSLARQSFERRDQAIRASFPQQVIGILE